MPDSLQAVTNTANQIQTTTSFSLLDILSSGGVIGIIIMCILFLMLVTALYIFFERYLSVKKNTVVNSNLINNIKDFVYDGKIDSALDLCKRTYTPESRLIHKGLQRIGRPIKEISDAIENSAQLEVYRLEKNINVLATIAGAAPMLGFLGTVIGMIQAFQKLAIQTNVGDKTQLLSEGIYTAMGTTAVGLIVGLVAYVFFNFMVSKVEKTVHGIQNSVTDFLDVINKPVGK